MTDDPATALRPKAIAHFGIQTRDIGRIRDWYCTVLNARVVYEKPGFFSTITFDEEHHRIAIIALPESGRNKYLANPEIFHVGFDMADLRTFLLNWERLRDRGITPAFSANHGATVSSYYFDPDGNQCELFADCFATKQECQDWFDSPYYQHNFGGGTPFDPEDALAKMRAGVSDEEIVRYPKEQGLAVNVDELVGQYLGGVAAEEERLLKEIAESVSEPAR